MDRPPFNWFNTEDKGKEKNEVWCLELLAERQTTTELMNQLQINELIQ